MAPWSCSGPALPGMATAVYLQRAGRTVTVLDPLGPAGGASFGNAGMISADTAAPIAMPGMLRRVPGWLADRDGPLIVRPAYAPIVMPWLMRWVRAGRLDRVMAISDAMRALHRDAFGCWAELVGPRVFAELIRRSGQIQVWDGGGHTPGAAIEDKIRERHGVETQRLGADDLRQMLPGIARTITAGLLVPGNGYTVSPARLVGALADVLRSEGGEILPERALKIIPRAGGGHTVLTNVANRPADAVVVATGAWSKQLLGPLGIAVPLETERGYHATLPSPSIEPRYTISYKSRGFGITPMEGGLRAAGSVEFAGLDAAPDERRAHVLAAHARALFPGLEARGANDLDGPPPLHARQPARAGRRAGPSRAVPRLWPQPFRHDRRTAQRPAGQRPHPRRAPAHRPGALRGQPLQLSAAAPAAATGWTAA